MSVDAVSGLSGSTLAPLNRAPAVTQVSAAGQTPVATQASGETTPPAPVKPAQPLLLVPTQPLSPTVLAELVGRHLSLNGFGPAG
jgi:hypothetical protein